jgi:proteasome beta subunit
MEMVKLFQLQIEHYEKIEGTALSLEGKANQLSAFVRSNLPAAMQGLLVVPIFAGFDHATGAGRIWDFDATGGRYEERDFVATGSGSLHAAAAIRLGWRSDLGSGDAVTLACRALWEASDADSATGGPDLARGIFPIVATVDIDGFRRIVDEQVKSAFERIVEEVRAR